MPETKKNSLPPYAEGRQGVFSFSFLLLLFSCLLFDIRLLKAKSLLAVDNLQQEAEQQGSHAKAGEHDQL